LNGGKKTVGRPREMLLDWVNKKNKMDYLQLKTKAENRTDWRQRTRTCLLGRTPKEEYYQKFYHLVTHINLVFSL